MWITVLIILFILGSIWSLKPSGIDQRVDKVRMAARQLGLNPKLVACPDWLRGKNNEYGKGMVAKYGIVIDDYKMPHVRYQMIENKWHPIALKELAHNSKETTTPNLNLSLAKTMVDLPTSMASLSIGLEAKANGIALYWHDVDYVRPATNPNFDVKLIEPELMRMKEQLKQWADDIH